MSDLLRISGVSKRFGGIQALDDVGIRVREGTIAGLIGPNGAGKTTFFNVITGLYPADQGRFELQGRPYSPHQYLRSPKRGLLEPSKTFAYLKK